MNMNLFWIAVGATSAILVERTQISPDSAPLMYEADCDGYVACTPLSTSSGPLLFVFAPGTGHSKGVCGCKTSDATEPPTLTCVEKDRCYANFWITVTVGVGKDLGYGGSGSEAATPGGNVTIPLGCSGEAGIGGCGCEGSVALESCDLGPQNTCINCTSLSAAVAACSLSQCADRRCD